MLRVLVRSKLLYTTQHENPTSERIPWPTNLRNLRGAIRAIDMWDTSFLPKFPEGSLVESENHFPRCNTRNRDGSWVHILHRHMHILSSTSPLFAHCWQALREQSYCCRSNYKLVLQVSHVMCWPSSVIVFAFATPGAHAQIWVSFSLFFGTIVTFVVLRSACLLKLRSCGLGCLCNAKHKLS